MFKKGDKVYSLRFGEGVVSGVDPTENFSIYVHCLASNEQFNEKGYYDEEDETPDLYHGKPQIIAPPEPDRRPHLEMDAPILVRGVENDPWQKRHFKKWHNNNRVICWPDGRTQYTANNPACTWGEWKLPEDD